MIDSMVVLCPFSCAAPTSFWFVALQAGSSKVYNNDDRYSTLHVYSTGKESYH
jgi:hypothetical protein